LDVDDKGVRLGCSNGKSPGRDTENARSQISSPFKQFLGSPPYDISPPSRTSRTQQGMSSDTQERSRIALAASAKSFMAPSTKADWLWSG